MGDCSSIAPTTEKVTIGNIQGTNLRLQKENALGMEDRIEGRCMFTGKNAQRKNYIAPAGYTQSGNFRELFVRWYLSLNSWHHILLLGSWLNSKNLSIVGRVMKLRSSESKLLIQIIVIMKFVEKFQKQVGPRVAINFR